MACRGDCNIRFARHASFRSSAVAAIALATSVACQGKQEGTAQRNETGCKCLEISLLYPSDQLGPDGKKTARGPNMSAGVKIDHIAPRKRRDVAE
jgi:hypothetical protein